MRALFLLACLASGAAAQDSSFASLRFRGSLLRNPVLGHIADDWRPRSGAEIEIATNVGRSELGLRLGRIAYAAKATAPDYAATLFTLAWTVRAIDRDRLAIDAGLRLTDYRMHFDDPNLVGGLRNEGEALFGVATRVSVRPVHRWSLFAEGSYGILMLSTRTPMLFVSAGVERQISTPAWLRSLLR